MLRSKYLPVGSVVDPHLRLALAGPDPYWYHADPDPGARKLTKDSK